MIATPGARQAGKPASRRAAPFGMMLAAGAWLVAVTWMVCS